MDKKKKLRVAEINYNNEITPVYHNFSFIFAKKQIFHWNNMKDDKESTEES